MPKAPPPPEARRLLAKQVKDKDAKAIAKIANVLRRQHGNMRETAVALGVTRSTLYLWCQQVPELQSAVSELARGRGNAHLVTHDGVTKTITEWAESLGKKRSTINMRILSGKPLDQALSPEPLDASATRRARAATKRVKKSAPKKRTKETS